MHKESLDPGVHWFPKESFHPDGDIRSLYTWMEVIKWWLVDHWSCISMTPGSSTSKLWCVKNDPDQQHVLFQNFVRQNGIKWERTIFHVRCSGYNHLNVADINICGQDQNIVITKTRSLYFEIPLCSRTLLCCKLPLRTLYLEVSCPTYTLLQSRLSPHEGDNLLQGGSLLRSRVSGADSLLRSKVFGGWFILK